MITEKLIALAVLLAVTPSSAADKEKAVDNPAAELHAQYKIPQGWDVDKKAEGPDRRIRVTKSAHVLQILYFGGGPKSRYAGADDFLRGPEATSMGRPPEAWRAARVSGRRVSVYRHTYPLPSGDPHDVGGGPSPKARETFCVLPAAGKAFFVLSYAWEAPVPESADEGEKAWAALLASFKITK
jgi:hypothetical protein